MRETIVFQRKPYQKAEAKMLRMKARVDLIGCLCVLALGLVGFAAHLITSDPNYLLVMLAGIFTEGGLLSLLYIRFNHALSQLVTNAAYRDLIHMRNSERWS